MARVRTSVWFFIVLVALAGLAIGIPYVYNLRQLLKPEDVEAARRRWAEHGPADYDLIWRDKLEEKGEQAAVAVYFIEVRGGELSALKMGDEVVDVKRLSAERREAFTVPGLLQRIARELDEDINSGKRNYITAYFDPKTGCPFRYVRRDREKKSRQEWTIKLTPPGSAE
jgi:hypothetical protein